MVSMFNNVLLPRKMLVSVGTIALFSVCMLSCNDTGNVVSGLKIRNVFGRKGLRASLFGSRTKSNSGPFQPFKVGKSKFTVQRMNTLGDGNCGIHAIWGDWLNVPTKDDPSSMALVAGGGTKGARKFFAKTMKEKREDVANDFGIQVMLDGCKEDMKQFEQNAAVGATADAVRSCKPIFKAMRKFEQDHPIRWTSDGDAWHKSPTYFAASGSLVPVFDDIIGNIPFAELYVDAISESDTYYLQQPELIAFGEVSGRPIEIITEQSTEQNIINACADKGKIVVRHCHSSDICESGHWERVKIRDAAGKKCWTDDLDVLMAAAAVPGVKINQSDAKGRSNKKNSTQNQRATKSKSLNQWSLKRWATKSKGTNKKPKTEVRDGFVYTNGKLDKVATVQATDPSFIPPVAL